MHSGRRGLKCLVATLVVIEAQSVIARSVEFIILKASVIVHALSTTRSALSKARATRTPLSWVPLTKSSEVERW
jgi:hypothetical protein